VTSYSRLRDKDERGNESRANTTRIAIHAFEIQNNTKKYGLLRQCCVCLLHTTRGCKRRQLREANAVHCLYVHLYDCNNM
jgi:hypothetical protein